MSNAREGIGSVSVTAFPGGFAAVELFDGDTVETVAERGDFELRSGHRFQVNGVDATRNTAVRNGDRITITEQVKGN